MYIKEESTIYIPSSPAINYNWKVESGFCSIEIVMKVTINNRLSLNKKTIDYNL